jgi:hypothetical protein
MTDHHAQFDLPEAHLHALDILLNRMPPLEYIWVLTGSASLRLQGVDVPVHDLDIQTDQKNVFLIEKRLAEFMKTPVHLWESTGMRSLDGKAVIEGIQIELLANIAHHQPDGVWCTYTDFSRVIWVETHGLRIPVFPLKDEFEAYQAMGRTEKAALIRKAIQIGDNN